MCGGNGSGRSSPARCVRAEKPSTGDLAGLRRTGGLPGLEFTRLGGSRPIERRAPSECKRCARLRRFVCWSSVPRARLVPTRLSENPSSSHWHLISQTPATRRRWVGGPRISRARPGGTPPCLVRGPPRGDGSSSGRRLPGSSSSRSPAPAPAPAPADPVSWSQCARAPDPAGSGLGSALRPHLRGVPPRPCPLGGPGCPQTDGTPDPARGRGLLHIDPARWSTWLAERYPGRGPKSPLTWGNARAAGP